MWTVGSQPAVDGARSDDPVHGFGPKGGYVFQKSFVEFFVRGRKEAEALAERIEQGGHGGVIKYYAGNKHVGPLIDSPSLESPARVDETLAACHRVTC